MYIDSFEARKAALQREKLNTLTMNCLVRDFISRALRHDYRRTPNSDDYDIYYCGIISLQAIKNFMGDVFSLSRETAEVMLEAAFFHYLQSYDEDKAIVKEFAQRLREVECANGRKKRMWVALHSTYIYVEPWPQESAVLQAHRMLNSSEF